MSLDLVRIDDRLIHGQVVIGWGTYLETTKIILCNDPIANSEEEKDLYMNAEVIAPYPVSISVWTHQQTLQELIENSVADEKIILLVETPKDILKLVEAGLKIEKVNVGGMHYKEGKRRITHYIYVNEEDIFCFKRLHKMGIQLEGKDVPSGKSINIAKIVNSDSP